jgi:2,4-diaminopentanoate dehydrogenase
MRKKVQVLIWGFGAMGGGMARMLLEKKGVEIAGVCDTHPDRKGRSIFSVLNLQQGDHRQVLIREGIEAALADAAGADIALLATDSFTREAYEKILLLTGAGLNVITTAEEMAYAQAAEPELAEEIDRAAKKHGVSVLGTGINPGLIMDLLVVLISGACINIDSIRAERVNSLSPFGPAVMAEQGVGLSPEAFAAKAADGSLAGHVGFSESIRMIADALGWKLSSPVEQSMEPIVSGVPRSTPFVKIQPGEVAGCSMRGRGFVGGKARIEMIHPQQIEPQLEGTETGDHIVISGTPDINLQIKPEVPGGVGTIAMCVNMIPQVLNASPGLKTMLDLPVPRAILGDMRDRLEGEA